MKRQRRSERDVLFVMVSEGEDDAGLWSAYVAGTFQCTYRSAQLPLLNLEAILPR